MMKKIVLAALLAIVSVGASAQFEKGTKVANLSLTGFDMSYQGFKEFHFGLQASGGYFVKQDWMVGGTLGYDYQGGGSVHVFDLGANFRYYFRKTGIFAGGGLLYQHYKMGAAQNWLSLTPEAGYCFYLNNHLSIEPAVYCHLCLNEFNDGSAVGLKIGVGYYF